jgi:hypothetical protein
MSRLMTVRDLVDEVRSLLDEENEDTIRDVEDIIPSLNRAYNKAWETISDSYPEPILQLTDSISVTTQEYTLPENLFEDKIKRIEWKSSNGELIKADRINYSDLWKYEITGSLNAPNMYAIYGRTVRFIGVPNGNYTMRLWALKEPERLVLPDGRITRTGTSGGDTFFSITEVNEDFDPEAGDLDSYINVIDGQTGEYKATYQVKSYSSNRVILRNTSDRSTVLNRTVTGGATYSTINIDDYICHVKGSCIPQLFHTCYNFIVQYSLAELKRNKLGMPYDIDSQLVQGFEKDLKDTFMGREQAAKIQKTNVWWKSNRYYFRRRGM